MKGQRQKEEKVEKRLTSDAELLNQFLSQYKYCIKAKKNLENRQREIMREFNTPLTSVKNDVKTNPSQRGDGCAVLAFQLDEIHHKIREQMERSAKILSNIFDTINLLPENTMERAIIENRYIDCYRWEEICKKNNISRTPAIKAWKKGLYALLEFDKVKDFLKEFQAR